MFGTNAAPEIYQHVIQQTLSRTENAASISDHVIEHGKTVDKHDCILEEFLKTIKAKNLTFNEERSASFIRYPQFDFMGFVLSENGNGSAEEKAKAVVNERELENIMSEVRRSWDL